MTIEEARDLLARAGDWNRMVEAVWYLASDNKSTLADLMLGLPHAGLVSEHAAMALYRRTGRPRPADGAEISTDGVDWLIWLLENYKGNERERFGALLATTLAAASRISPSVAAHLATVVDEAAKLDSAA